MKNIIFKKLFLVVCIILVFSTYSFAFASSLRAIDFDIRESEHYINGNLGDPNHVNAKEFLKLKDIEPDYAISTRLVNKQAKLDSNLYDKMVTTFTVDNMQGKEFEKKLVIVTMYDYRSDVITYHSAYLSKDGANPGEAKTYYFNSGVHLKAENSKEENLIGPLK